LCAEQLSTKGHHLGAQENLPGTSSQELRGSLKFRSCAVELSQDAQGIPNVRPGPRLKVDESGVPVGARVQQVGSACGKTGQLQCETRFGIAILERTLEQRLAQTASVEPRAVGHERKLAR
jgi:hypothetical protein